MHKRLKLTRMAGIGLVLMAVLPVVALAEVPPTVDSFGGSAFAAGVHAIVGSNNDPNFSNGAVGNRYPLTSATQDISPATQASASVNDYGPLVSTILGTDCNSGTPPANYCLEPVRGQAPYANAQYPHPPGVGDASVSGPGGTNSGSGKAHAEELKASSDGNYTGAPAVSVTVDNATAHSETGVGPDGTITVHTHSHVGSFCIGVCGTVNYVIVRDTDVTTTVTAVNGVPKPDAVVAPGHVEYCATSTTCQPVQADNNGVVVGPAGQTLPVPGVGAAGSTTVFRIRTIAPKEEVHGSTASVDAVGLDIVATQPGNAANGVPDSSVEYVLGEGHADGFSLASLISLTTSSSGSTDLTGTGSTDFGTGSGPIASAIGDTALPPNGSDAGTTPVPATKPVARRGALSRNAVALASAIHPPFALWFFVWEASILVAAASMVWARRYRLTTEDDE